jgi:hypothetical protein
MSLIKVSPPQKFFFIGLLKNFLCRKQCYLFVDAENGFHLTAFLDHRGSICTCYFYFILFQSNSAQMYQNLLFVNCLNWNLKLQNLGEYIYAWDMSKLL